ncbi:MAG: hypothetical protein WAW92_03355 [Minisyncoccia bacterium]
MRFREPTGYTGKISETELFGNLKFEKGKEQFEYIPRRAAFDAVREMQPFDPSDPGPDFANAVHALIFEKLEIDADELKYYTAVGSPLDVYHGIDAWFEYKGKIVTIDSTLRPDKDEHKADIVFHPPSDGLDRKVDKDQFIRYCEQLAEEVILHLRAGGHENQAKQYVRGN